MLLTAAGTTTGAGAVPVVTGARAGAEVPAEGAAEGGGEVVGGWSVTTAIRRTRRNFAVALEENVEVR